MSREPKICQLCGKTFLRKVAPAKLGAKNCPACSALAIPEAPKRDEYSQTAKMVDRLVQ
jgi:hypothetical protein